MPRSTISAYVIISVAVLTCFTNNLLVESASPDLSSQTPQLLYASQLTNTLLLNWTLPSQVTPSSMSAYVVRFESAMMSPESGPYRQMPVVQQTVSGSSTVVLVTAPVTSGQYELRVAAYQLTGGVLVLAGLPSTPLLYPSPCVVTAPTIVYTSTKLINSQTGTIFICWQFPQFTDTARISNFTVSVYRQLPWPPVTIATAIYSALAFSSMTPTLPYGLYNISVTSLTFDNCQSAASDAAVVQLGTLPPTTTPLPVITASPTTTAAVTSPTIEAENSTNITTTAYPHPSAQLPYQIGIGTVAGICVPLIILSLLIVYGLETLIRRSTTSCARCHRVVPYIWLSLLRYDLHLQRLGQRSASRSSLDGDLTTTNSSFKHSKDLGLVRKQSDSGQLNNEK